jgi:hypothetical protein
VFAAGGSSPPFFRLARKSQIIALRRKPPQRLAFILFLKVGSQIA